MDALHIRNGELAAKMIGEPITRRISSVDLSVRLSNNYHDMVLDMTGNARAYFSFVVNKPCVSRWILWWVALEILIELRPTQMPRMQSGTEKALLCMAVENVKIVLRSCQYSHAHLNLDCWGKLAYKGTLSSLQKLKRRISFADVPPESAPNSDSAYASVVVILCPSRS